MSAEKPTKPGITLTSDQAEKIAETIVKKWDGKKGIRLSEGVLEKLIKEYGKDAKLKKVLEEEEKKNTI